MPIILNSTFIKVDTWMPSSDKLSCLLINPSQLQETDLRSPKMSLKLNKNNSSTPLFHEFKKQASVFLKEQFKSARLALTDVTPAQLMTEEATNGNSRTPDSPSLRSISKAAFELDDYWRIVEILHKRLLKFDNGNWRASYNSLIVLEHLLTHGPESIAEEFQSDKDVISLMINFQYIDDKGFNWGLIVRKKSERILKLMEEGTVLKEERNRARRLSRGIQGFGSFSKRPTSKQGILQEKSLPDTFGRCNSDFNNHENQEDQFSFSNQILDSGAVKSPSLSHHGGVFNSVDGVGTESYMDGLRNNEMLNESETSSNENMIPGKKECHMWNLKGESSLLLEGNQEDSRIQTFIAEEDHPFSSAEVRSTSSLLSTK